MGVGPKHLEIEYFHAIPAQDFAKATSASISRNTSLTAFQRLKPTVEEFNDLYRDIAPGDRYALTYRPGSGTTLSWNGRALGTAAGAEFGAALFGIWLVSLFKVFWLQALFLWVIAVVVQVPQVAAEPDHLTVWDAAGLIVWAVGFVFETVADAQLARFKADHRSAGQVLDRGLWRYSRHPNYFGECLIWWGLFLIALSVSGGFWTVVSPIIITLVLLKMTGVALTERTIVEHRPAYRDYQRRTSTFIPWRPKPADR